jgi:hypothetical protein
MFAGRRLQRRAGPRWRLPSCGAGGSLDVELVTRHPPCGPPEERSVLRGRFLSARPRAGPRLAAPRPALCGAAAREGRQAAALPPLSGRSAVNHLRCCPAVIMVRRRSAVNISAAALQSIRHPFAQIGTAMRWGSALRSRRQTRRWQCSRGARCVGECVGGRRRGARLPDWVVAGRLLLCVGFCREGLPHGHEAWWPMQLKTIIAFQEVRAHALPAGGVGRSTVRSVVR